MPVQIEPRYTLIASGNRLYTFTPLPSGVEVEVLFRGPYRSTKAVVPVDEARTLYASLIKKGYERW